MEILARPDLVHPWEELPSSVAEPFPIIGSLPDAPRISEYQSATNLRFVELTANQISDPQSLIEQTQHSSVIVYCSSWGSGIEGKSGLSDVIAQTVNDFLDSEREIDAEVIPQEMSLAITTIALSFQNSDRKFYVAGSFDTYTDLEEADLAREAAYEQFIEATHHFQPLDRQLETLDSYTSSAASYGNLVSTKARADIQEIIEEHPGENIAVIIDSPFQALPRFFDGSEAGVTNTPLVMSHAHTAWDKMHMMMSLHSPVGTEEDLKARNPELDAQRFWLEQMIYLKQLGQPVPEYMPYFALYSKVDQILGSDHQVGTGAEYRLTSHVNDPVTQAAVVTMLGLVSDRFYARINKSIRYRSNDALNKLLRQLGRTWYGHDVS